MKVLAPRQGSPEWSFQIFRITSCSEACAGWYESAAQEERLAEGQEKGNEVYCARKFLVPEILGSLKTLAG
jgi:hypothetical protein